MNFVLQRYEQDGVEELGEDKLGDLIKLSTFGTIQDAEQAFGGLHQIKQAYNAITSKYISSRMSELSNKIDQVRDILRTDDGISGAMDYTQAISWVLFLKFLDDYEQQNSKEAFRK